MEDLDTLEAELDSHPQPLAAIEACWDGDVHGWFLRLYAVFEGASADHPRYTSKQLRTLTQGGMLRLFHREDPPWPEARMANALGEALASKRGVPFYFPAPMLPDDQVARWWDRDQAHRCSDCGVALRDGYVGRPWPWPGACAQCIAARVRAGAVHLNVHLTGVDLDTAEEFEAQRDPWFAAIVDAKVGLVKLVNALSDSELWVMLVVDGRDVGVDAVLRHLETRGQKGGAVVTVDGMDGRPERVWPPG